MFRVQPGNRFKGPHQGQHRATAGAEADEAELAVILIHGRGATAESILMLADELDADGVHYIAPQAANYTWYPYSFLEPTEKNEPGLSSGLQAIADLLMDLDKAGFARNKVILAGFSQGGCLASEFAARHPGRFGGVVAFSGGLIGDRVEESAYQGDFEGTPVFLGCSDRDPHIPADRVDETETVFRNIGADVVKKIYPGMPHTVNRDELEQMKKLIDAARSE